MQVLHHRLLRRIGVVAVAASTAVLGVTGLAGASVSTDAYYYNVGDTVQITGDQMAPGENVAVDVDYPDGSLAQEHVVVADDLGDFSDSYTLPLDAPGGIYTVVATGQTSGDVYTTTFDPCSLSLSDASVQYSDVATFTGSLGSSGTACAGGVAGRTIDIIVDTNGDGSFVGESVFASGTTNTSGGFSINSGQISLDPSFATDQGTGIYKMEAQLDGTATKSTPFSKLTVSKEDTVTTYTGLTSGAVNSSLSLNATVADADSSFFANDPNLNGTVTFQLYTDLAGTLGNEVGTAVTGTLTADTLQSGLTYTLPSTPGTYYMKVTYGGDDYYNGSSGSPLTAITVTGSTCIFSAIQPPVNQVDSASDTGMSIYKFGARGVIPIKYQLTCDGDLVDTQAEADAHQMTLAITLVDAGDVPTGGDTEVASAGSANTDNIFRFDDTADQYIYNLSIKGMAVGIYRITATSGSASTKDWFSIK